MLFVIFLCFAHAIPVLPVSIEKNTPCSPVLYALIPQCTVDNNAHTITRTGFFWDGSFWTTHRTIAGSTQLMLGGAYTLEIQDPRANFVQLKMDGNHDNWTSTTTVHKNDDVLCVGFDENGDLKEHKGMVVDQAVSIIWNGAPTPPLLEVSCSVSSSMLGGVVTHNQKLVGMITAYQDQTTYALPVDRLRSSSLRLGLHVEEEVTQYSIHSDIPQGSEVIAMFRNHKKVFPPLIQLQEKERLRIQLLEDDVWISPHHPQYNRIFIFEEREGAHYVLQPSQTLANLGLREQDRWLPDQNTPVVAFYRGTERLLILNPSWWETKVERKIIK